MDTSKELQELIRKYEKQLIQYRQKSKPEIQPAATSAGEEPAAMPNPPATPSALQPDLMPVPEARPVPPPMEEMPLDMAPPDAAVPEETPSDTVLPPDTPLDAESESSQNTSAFIDTDRFEHSFLAPTIDVSQIIVPDNQNLTGSGTVQIQTLSARNAIPVEGAAVTISWEENAGKNLIYHALTDINGKTPVFTLPTVAISESLTPENPAPYAAYNIRVVCDGFFTVENINVPIFDKQLAIQTVELIPFPENYIGDRTSVINQTGSITLH